MEEGDRKAVLVTGGYDHTVKLWQAHTGICYWTGQHADSQVNALAITPDKQKVAAAGFQHIRLYDLNSTSSTPVINYEGVSKNVTSVGFQEDCKWMFTTGEDCSARIWDLRCRNVQCHRIFQTNTAVNCAVLHPNQSELIMCDDTGVIHVWNLRTDHNEQLMAESEVCVQCVSVDTTGQYLSSVNNMGHCHVWGLQHSTCHMQLTPKQKILAHARQALSCKFSPDSKLLVTTSADETARLWKTDDFTLMQEFKLTGQRWVWDAAFTADSRYLITASSDGIARLWSVVTGQVEREYTGHQKAIVAMAFADT